MTRMISSARGGPPDTAFPCCATYDPRDTPASTPGTGVAQPRQQAPSTAARSQLLSAQTPRPLRDTAPILPAHAIAFCFRTYPPNKRSPQQSLPVPRNRSVFVEREVTRGEAGTGADLGRRRDRRCVPEVASRSGDGHIRVGGIESRYQLLAGASKRACRPVAALRLDRLAPTICQQEPSPGRRMSRKQVER